MESNSRPICTCPVIWHGLEPPPCAVHNPTRPSAYGANGTCEVCGALVADPAKHAQWHDAQATVARNADLGAMSMRPIGGPRR